MAKNIIKIMKIVEYVIKVVEIPINIGENIAEMATKSYLTTECCLNVKISTKTYKHFIKMFRKS